MPKTGAFETEVARYEAWFETHPAAYESEVQAVRELWPSGVDGVEIGVGAGHFAGPLGIRTAVEPAAAMRQAAARRGIRALDGTAEQLPFAAARFDAALMVTTLCFVDDPERAMREMYRVLRPAGCAVVGFVDRDSRLGQTYERKRASSAFYAEARFFSAREVCALLSGAGFVDLESRQTLFHHPAALPKRDRVAPGYGAGAFVVVRGWKPPRLPPRVLGGESRTQSFVPPVSDRIRRCAPGSLLQHGDHEPPCGRRARGRYAQHDSAHQRDVFVARRDHEGRLDHPPPGAGGNAAGGRTGNRTGYGRRAADPRGI